MLPNALQPNTTDHVPVLADEVRELLAVHPGETAVDTTFGAGGHARLLAADLRGEGKLIAIDRDPAVRPYFESFRRQAGVQARLLHGDFADVLERLASNGVRADAVLFDLGVSSMQIDRPERGFSYAVDAPLDMRMDPTEEYSASDLVNDASAKELEKIFRRFGEERYAKSIARAIVERRRKAEITRTFELVETIRGAVADKPLSIDSASPAAARAGLERLPKGSAFLNSISGESARLDAMLPLAIEFETRIVALAMDDSGMPSSIADRWRAIDRIFAATDKAGLFQHLETSLRNLRTDCVDPLVRPVATNPEQAVQVLDMIRDIRAKAGGAGTVVGLSNVSYGLPVRRHLNRTFLAMAIAAGLTAAIIDPLEQDMMTTIYAAHCLTGQDSYCMNYIMAQRAGKL